MARVRGGTTDFDVCVHHRSFVLRHRVGPGSLLSVWRGRCVTRVLRPGHRLRSFPDTTRFGRWFRFRTLCLPRPVLRLLFVAGIETWQALEEQQETLVRLKGIGPVTQQRIQRVLKIPRWIDSFD